ncbi:imidazole glycerol phosphate synthase subunit HisH [Pseudomonas tohonis]|uniref:imidazole glycerol phosphate synthase subunit HisH n=1 Tax=Pseudomonas tohonis TaxID=2725477 RepID=UPI0035A23B09
MSNQRITVLDYGMCNLFSVVRAFEYCGAAVEVVEDPAQVAFAERLVVPGVGAFRDSMREIVGRGYDEAIKGFVETGRPLFGICVGMQMLFDASEEFGIHPGLSILPGRVQSIPKLSRNGAEPLRVPHIGWSHLQEPRSRTWSGSFLEPLQGLSPAVYFVHSFVAIPGRETDLLAECDYGGHMLCAAVQHQNVMATQFHPERSGIIGLNIIRNFCAL